MMSYDFQTSTHAKAILAGEHAVLRGHPIIVLPVKCFELGLQYRFNTEEPRAEFAGECSEQMHLAFWSIIERGLEMVKLSLSDMQGQFIVQNNIPAGAGLGASAALCVAVARWFAWRELIGKDDIAEFAVSLEHLFHGESSGVDVAAVCNDSCIWFENINSYRELSCNWQPNLYISYSGQVGITASCVNKVKQLWQSNPTQAQAIDETMHQAVELTAEALQAGSTEEGTTLLAQAMNQARVCFNRWGLAQGNVEQHINKLLSAGALAAKPTGSGDGGYVLSLWQGALSEPLIDELIKI